MSKTYSEKDYEQIVLGKEPLPNFEPVTLEYFCDAISAGGHHMTPKWGWAKNDRGGTDWAQYFLTNLSNMGSAPDGTGYVCAYGGNSRRVGTFAICKHEKKAGAGANPSRGWHPGSCAKCGMDMTIDSGD